MRKLKYSGIEWIGDIPECWEVLPHKRIMEKTKNICEKYNGEDILSLTIGGIIKRDLDNPKGKMPATFDGYQRVEEGNLLLCLFDIDVTPRCVGLIKNNGLTSPAYSQFKMKGSNNARYYDYLLRMIDNDKCFLHLSKNLRSSLTETDFGIIKTVVPPLNEQEKIADYLDKKMLEINDIIYKTKDSIEQYKKYKQSTITEVVTKGLNKNVEMKNSGIEFVGDIPNNWSVVPLKYMVDTNTQSLGENTDPDYDFDYIEIGSVTFEKGIEKKERVKFKDSPSRARRIVKKDDVIISTVRTYLKAITTIPDVNDTIVSTGFAVLTPKDILAEYLGYYVKSNCFAELVSANSYGVSYPAISASSLVKFKIAVPCRDEQLKIKQYLDEKCNKIENIIKKKEQLIVELENYKKSLIYECVTGKKEI